MYDNKLNKRKTRNDNVSIKCTDDDLHKRRIFITDKIDTLNVEITQTQFTPDSVWATGAPILWSQTLTGVNVKVGVLDTGIDNTHPDLQNRVILRRDFVNDGATPPEFNPHGTHVAGIIGANGRMKGVAIRCKLIDYRVLDKSGTGSIQNIISALDAAILDGCQIVNLSLGTSADFSSLHDAIRRATNAGILVVAAAGNEGENTITYPAFYPESMSVGAVNFDSSTGLINIPQEPWFSSTNSQVDVAADGWRVTSTVPGGGYAIYTGTSMATPHISGIAALLQDKTRRRTGSFVNGRALFTTIKSMTIDVHTRGIDTLTGAGFVTFFPNLLIKTNGVWTVRKINNFAPS